MDNEVPTGGEGCLLMLATIVKFTQNLKILFKVILHESIFLRGKLHLYFLGKIEYSARISLNLAKLVVLRAFYLRDNINFIQSYYLYSVMVKVFIFNNVIIKTK